MIHRPDAPQPVLHTERIVLRPFAAEDADAVHVIVSDREIAANTASIPHPYPEGMAAEWIVRNERVWTGGEGAVFAMATAEDGVVGAFGVHLEPPHDRAEIGYWVARPHWNRGLATEAGLAIVPWAVPFFGLHRVEARHLTRNPASGAVMRRLGMRHEGTLRGQMKKWGVYEDVEIYSLLATELP